MLSALPSAYSPPENGRGRTGRQLALREHPAARRVRRDGTVQGLLDMAGIPYVGSGVAGQRGRADRPWRTTSERPRPADGSCSTTKTTSLLRAHQGAAFGYGYACARERGSCCQAEHDRPLLERPLMDRVQLARKCRSTSDMA